MKSNRTKQRKRRVTAPKSAAKGLRERLGMADVAMRATVMPPKTLPARGLRISVIAVSRQKKHTAAAMPKRQVEPMLAPARWVGSRNAHGARVKRVPSIPICRCEVCAGSMLPIGKPF